MSNVQISWVFGVCSLLGAIPALANGIGGCQTVSLHGVDGERLDIGQLRLSNPLGQDKLKAVFLIDHAVFEHSLLSVHSFQCMSADGTLCYVHYPYENSQNVSTQDLRYLEYQLLFARQQSSGGDWRTPPGTYYRLSWDSSIGSTLTGIPHAVNLDRLTSPLEGDTLYPISDDDLQDMTSTAHALPIIKTRKGC